jgi:hypothetical protein
VVIGQSFKHVFEIGERLDIVRLGSRPQIDANAPRAVDGTMGPADREEG